MSYTLTFTKEGYASATVGLHCKVRAWIVIGDVLLLTPGLVVDAVTGAWCKLVPEPVTVSLTKIAAAPGPDTITVGIRLSETEDARQVDVQPSAPGVLMHVELKRIH